MSARTGLEARRSAISQRPARPRSAAAFVHDVDRQGPTLPPTRPWSCEEPGDEIVSMPATTAIGKVRIDYMPQ